MRKKTHKNQQIQRKWNKNDLWFPIEFTPKTTNLYILIKSDTTGKLNQQKENKKDPFSAIFTHINVIYIYCLSKKSWHILNSNFPPSKLFSAIPSQNLHGGKLALEGGPLQYIYLMVARVWNHPCPSNEYPAWYPH